MRAAQGRAGDCRLRASSDLTTGGTIADVIGGTCDSRFAAVRDAFAANFTERGEAGAAVCLTVDGRVVAGLWGGWSD